MIGLSGAHRTGKSALARAFAKKHKLTFVETSASAVFQEMGLDPSVTYDFSTRLTIQEEILKRFDKLYASHTRSDMSITDRTPLDMLAYTMAEAIGDTVLEEDQKRFEKYIQSCFDVLNKRFSTLIVIQPGIQIVAEEGKAALNNAYIEHLNSLILGLSVDERVKAAHFYIPRHMKGMEDRIAAVEFAASRTAHRMAVELEGSTLH